LGRNNFAKAKIGYHHTLKSNHIPLIIGSAKKMARFYHNKKKYRKTMYYLRYLAKYDAKNIWPFLSKDINKNKSKLILRYYPLVINLITDSEYKSKYFFWLGVTALKLKFYKTSQDYFKQSYLCYPYSYYSIRSLSFIKKYSKKRLFTLKAATLVSQMKNREKSFFKQPLYQHRYRQSFYAIFNKNIHPVLNRALLFFETKDFHLANKELSRFLDITPEKERYYRGLMYYFYNKKYPQYYNQFADKLIQFLNGQNGNHYIPKSLVHYYTNLWCPVS
jgi:hypothetical protein